MAGIQLVTVQSPPWASNCGAGRPDRWATIARSGNRAPDVSATAGFVPRSTSAPRTDTPPPVATKGILAPQHAQAEDAFHMVVRGLDTSIDANNHNAGYSARDWRKRSPPWNPPGADLAPKHLGVRVQSDPTGLAAPVGPVRRGGTPTSRRTGIPRHPDPPGQLLQRVLLDRPASESRVSGGPNRFPQVQRQLVVDRPAVATDDAGDRLAQRA